MARRKSRKALLALGKGTRRAKIERLHVIRMTLDCCCKSFLTTHERFYKKQSSRKRRKMKGNFDKHDLTKRKAMPREELVEDIEQFDGPVPAKTPEKEPQPPFRLLMGDGVCCFVIEPCIKREEDSDLEERPPDQDDDCDCSCESEDDDCVYLYAAVSPAKNLALIEMAKDHLVQHPTYRFFPTSTLTDDDCECILDVIVRTVRRDIVVRNFPDIDGLDFEKSRTSSINR